jgi:hypothetical protein
MDIILAAPATDTTSRIENRPVDEVLLSLNIAGALFFAALVYVLKNWASMKPMNDSTYVFLRSLYRVVDFLGLQSQNPVATSAVRRQFPTRPEQLGAEVFVIVTWLGITAAAMLLLWLLRRTRVYCVIVRQAAMAILLFAAPVCYLCVSWNTWNWPYEPVVRAGSFFTQSLPLAVFLIEIICLGSLLLFFNRKEMPQWVRVLLVSAHFIFWMIVLWSETRVLLFPIYARGLILLLLPASTLMYILRAKLFSRCSEKTTRSRKTTWTLASAASALVAAAVVWSPARNIELSHSQNLDLATVELSRGPCYGSCPAYTITVHADGQVRYVGLQGHSRTQTKKSGTIGKEKVAQILQVLDRVEFIALEGRAFTWAFDTPTIGVRTSVDGKTKQVASDAVFVGPPKGRQAQFVKAAGEIDSILASSTWLKCEGECEGSTSSP